MTSLTGIPLQVTVVIVMVIAIAAAVRVAGGRASHAPARLGLVLWPSLQHLAA